MDCDTVNTTSTRLALGDRTNVTSARVFDDWRPTCEALRRKRAREDSEDDYSPPSSSPTKSRSAGMNHEISLVEVVAPVKASRKKARNACALRLIRDSLCALRPPLSLPLSTRRILQSLVSADNTDVYRPQYLAPCPPFNCAYSNAAKSGQNSQLAIVTEHGAVEICNAAKRDAWDLEPSRVTFAPHDNAIYEARWRVDDEFIATCSGDNTVAITSTKTQETTARLVGHKSGVKNVVWNPTQPNILASSGRDGCICIWDLRKPAADQDGDVTQHDPTITIKSAHDPTSKRKRNLPRSAGKSVTSIIYLPSSPFHLVSSGSSDSILKTWDVRNIKAASRPVVTTEEDPSFSGISTKRSRGIISLVLSGDGNNLYGLCANSTIYPYVTQTLQSCLPLNPPRTLPNTSKNLSFHSKVAISECGRWLASGGPDGRAYTYDIGKTRSEAERAAVVLKGQTCEVTGVDWAAGGQLATCSDDGTVRVWRPDLEQRGKCREDPDASWNWKWADMAEPRVETETA